MRDWKKWLLENLDLPTMVNGRDHRIVAELADHLDDLRREARARGLSEAEAEAQVLAWVGDPALAPFLHPFKESRSADSPPAREIRSRPL